MQDQTEPTNPEPKDPRTREEILASEKRLAARVVWAMKYLKNPGGGMVSTVIGGEIETQDWLDWFCDAIDERGGAKVDRKALREQREPRRRRRA